MPDSVIPILRAIVALVAASTTLAPKPWAPKRAQPAQAASRFALAIVSDPKGKAIVDIGADDFVVQEGGVSREILDVRVADYPVVVIVDNGTAASEDFVAIKAAVGAFIGRRVRRTLAILRRTSGP